ncbi:AMP-dependent synthetase/ligase [Pelobacter propionicus]|uniref:AMP-dependent synthetase and ligase n=1 Tax=Pelobacter propionicus (strain DSM 2379 / NBRC 103807 / OttBd1) TaxID=338966 RepID=A1AUQ5_PELPD|nr:AMP-binding protein [Pelobacter propionicus]ABL01076.1 AMP-dependent synthetase and ligase [Pelobacter propionicus DSM 2379]
MHTIDSLIRESCRINGDRPALRHKVGNSWREISYGALWELSDHIAAGLLKSGFRSGDHAALLAPSSPNWVAAYLAILKAGGVVVPIDKELKSAELRHILTNCHARVVFSSPPCLDALLQTVNHIAALERIVVLSPAAEERSDSQLARSLSELVEEWRDLAASIPIPRERVQRLEELGNRFYQLSCAPASSRGDQKEVVDPFSAIEAIRTQLTREGRLLTLDALCHSAPLPEKPRSPQDPAVILYTSGTTGRSKGAMLSHANIVSNILETANHFGLDSSIHTLSFLPINHVFEQVCGVLLPLALGGRVTFCESLKKLGENLAEVKPTFFLAVPAVYRMLLDRIMKNIQSKRVSRTLFSLPLVRTLVTSKVRRTFGAGTIYVSGGAALDPAIARGLDRVGLNVYQGYGITETSPVISAEHPGKKRLGTVGLPLRCMSIRIDTPNQEGVGELVVKGPNVMLGYYNNPQATAEVLQDGWYRTGDLARVDGDGFLTICGRVKNLIVTPNGKNVYPEEVEAELLKSPYIAEVMVYGHRVGPAEEEVHAMIYPNQEALEDHCRKMGNCPMDVKDVEALVRREVQAACAGLADYKRVRRFTLREDEFPKTTTRKIKRFAVGADIDTGE